ncbi:MAG: NAD(P)(+) transhydrogenase (Re/Si-specific) subunit alpha, partial [Bacteroidota bacterium]
MIIAVPKEIFLGENRVALVPDTASKLIKRGFEIIVEKGAGVNAGFTDEKYEQAGAKLISDLYQLYSLADIVLKVQRPAGHPDLKKNEFDLMKKGTLLITF